MRNRYTTFWGKPRPAPIWTNFDPKISMGNEIVMHINGVIKTYNLSLLTYKIMVNAFA